MVIYDLDVIHVPGRPASSLQLLQDKSAGGASSEGKRHSAPVQMGKKSLDPVYCKRVLRQLKFTNEEIEMLLD